LRQQNAAKRLGDVLLEYVKYKKTMHGTQFDTHTHISNQIHCAKDPHQLSAYPKVFGQVFVMVYSTQFCALHFTWTA
jgi:hypothetical protein